MSEIYLLREAGDPGQYIITKFDEDINPLSNYLVSYEECACPRGHKPTCRHRQMLPFFKKHKHIGDGWFLDFHTRKWIAPVADDIDAASADDVGRPEAPAADEQTEVVKVLPPASDAPTVPPQDASSPSAAGAPIVLPTGPRKGRLFVRPL